MVWIYHLVNPSHPLEKHCQRLLNDLVRGRVKGIASSFVVHEVVDVTRRLLAEKRNREAPQADLEAMEERVEREMARLGVDIHDADVLALNQTGQSVVFDRAADISRASGASQGRHDRRWRTVGGADSIHVALAERSGASHYATCDEGFRKLVANVQPTILEDSYP